jgi:hypothetical protein
MKKSMLILKSEIEKELQSLDRLRREMAEVQQCTDHLRDAVFSYYRGTAVHGVVVLIALTILILFIPVDGFSYELPPYGAFRLKVNAELRENYTNNITFAKDDEDRIEQFTTLAILGLNLNYEGKKGRVGFDGQIRRPIRFDDSDVRNSSDILTLNVQHDFSQYDGINLYNRFTHTKVPGSIEVRRSDDKCEDLYKRFGLNAIVNDPECSEFAVEFFGREQGDFDSYENSFHFNYTKFFSEKIKIRTEYGNRLYDSTKRGSNDSFTNRYSVFLSYQYDYTRAFSLFYELRNTDYDRGDDISIDSVKAGIRQYLTKRILINGNIGMDFAPSTDTLSIDASVLGELDEKSTMQIFFSRSVQSAVDREDVFRNWQVTCRYSRSFSEDFKGFSSVYYGQGDFVSADFTDTLLGASVSVHNVFWQHKKGSSLTGIFGYSYSQLDSTNSERGYERSSVTASLTLSF